MVKSDRLSIFLLVVICTGYIIDSSNAAPAKSSLNNPNRRKFKKEDHMEPHPEHGRYMDALSFKKPWVSGKIEEMYETNIVQTQERM